MYDVSLRKDGTISVSEDRLQGLRRWSVVNEIRRCRDETPIALTTERGSRDSLRRLLELSAGGEILLEPMAKECIESSLSDIQEYNAPLRPPTDHELVAYADELGVLKCIQSVSEEDGLNITKGTEYPIRTGSTAFTEKFTRKKPYFDADEGVIKVIEHTCELAGVDRYIRIVDDKGQYHFFRDRPGPHENQHQEGEMWEYFEKPEVNTIKEVAADRFASNLQEMKTFEAIGGFTYYPGQVDYWARMGIKKYGLGAGDTGTGKTLGALTLAWLHKAERIVIVAPKGTVENEMGEKREYDPAQWVAEIKKFCPFYDVYTLFNQKDVEKVNKSRGEDGQIKPGIYITYPSAFLRNGALEYKPGSWSKIAKVDAEADFRKRMDIPESRMPEEFLHGGLGVMNEGGVLCVAKPCVASVMGREFDMILIDEAHLMRSLESIQTRALLRVQAGLRYAFSATPIPNQITNIFPILGYLAIDDWYKGGRRNASFPYAIEEVGRFEAQFMSKEFDVTEEYKRKRDDRNWNGRIRSNSAVISSPSRLLKLLKPILAYISKDECNPDMVDCVVTDIRVPMGADQMKLYAKYLDRKMFIPKDMPHKDRKEKAKMLLAAALRQTNALRAICANPKGPFAGKHEKDKDLCASNFNPKIVTIMELVKECMCRDEQVVIVYSRVGQGDEIASRLADCGVTYGRIDSTTKKHSVTASLFKKRKLQVLGMGINCAQAYSFENCNNLIVASLDWGYGSLHQAMGRIYRLNSPTECKMYVMLFENTIEEAIFDRVATKQDAATLCLHGQRVERDYKQMEASEVLADHIINFEDNGKARPESACEKQWQELAGAISECEQEWKA